ncbi:MAG: hypothetical protein ACYC5Y_03400 [Symbiobacteriia bacterium]
MQLELWVICTKCGAGHTAEDFARQDPAKARSFPIQTLPHGAEENNLDTVWLPTCRECGNHTFHVQLDPEDMIEVWEQAPVTDFALPGTPDREESLRLWRERADQQEAEFAVWRARRRSKQD